MTCSDPNLESDCSGCTDLRDDPLGGTHSGCTKQHGHIGCDKVKSPDTKERCTKCNAPFLLHEHKHIIQRDGVYHTNCYKNKIKLTTEVKSPDNSFTTRECINGHKMTGVGFDSECPECEDPWKS